MANEKQVFVGIIISPISLNNTEIFTGFLSIENGKITRKGTKNELEQLKKEGVFQNVDIIYLEKTQLLVPGFVDCHTHAPQFPNIGLGLDLPLLDWLHKYTFPLENQYRDLDFARNVYQTVVKQLINNGTTTACYFGSIHLEGTLELVKCIAEQKQRAIVGKVSMNIRNDAGYYNNNTENEIDQVKKFIKTVRECQNELIAPIITPRFAISCDDKLMSALGELSQQFQCRIQSHISENKSEIEYVLKMYPDCKTYAQVYDKNKLLNDKCIMAHAVHLSRDEMQLFRHRGVSVAHCPASNTRLKSGLCPVRKLIENGVTVGLGTDVAGGDSASMLEAMRRAMDVSIHLEVQNFSSPALTWQEAYYLATLGGAKALGLETKIGNFEIGKEFDALIVDVYAKDGAISNYKYDVASNPEQYSRSLLERFIYLGDDRNIVGVYVNGVMVKKPL